MGHPQVGHPKFQKDPSSLEEILYYHIIFRKEISMGGREGNWKRIRHWELIFDELKINCRLNRVPNTCNLYGYYIHTQSLLLCFSLSVCQFTVLLLLFRDNKVQLNRGVQHKIAGGIYCSDSQPILVTFMIFYTSKCHEHCAMELTCICFQYFPLCLLWCSNLILTVARRIINLQENIFLYY